MGWAGLTCEGRELTGEDDGKTLAEVIQIYAILKKVMLSFLALHVFCSKLSGN